MLSAQVSAVRRGLCARAHCHCLVRGGALLLDEFGRRVRSRLAVVVGARSRGKAREVGRTFANQVQSVCERRAEKAEAKAEAEPQEWI